METTAKILVTGATGLVGSAILASLSSQGKSVKAFTFNKSKQNTSLKNVEWIYGDILDVSVLDDAMQGIDVVYHCLDFMSYLETDSQKLYDINVKGTENVVNMALANEVRKIVYISSTQAFGTHQHKGKITEKTNWIEHKDNSLYAICKNRAELEIWRGQEEGLQTLILSPSIIIAPLQEKLYNFGHIAKSQYNFYPNGKNGFIALKDVAEASIYLNEHNVSGEKFILNSENLTYAEVLSKWNPKIKNTNIGNRMNAVKANIIWQVNKFRDIVFGARPFLTKDIYNFNNKLFEFNNKKVVDACNIKFAKIADYIDEIKQ